MLNFRVCNSFQFDLSWQGGRRQGRTHLSCSKRLSAQWPRSSTTPAPQLCRPQDTGIHTEASPHIPVICLPVLPKMALKGEAVTPVIYLEVFPAFVMNPLEFTDKALLPRPDGVNISAPRHDADTWAGKLTSTWSVQVLQVTTYFSLFDPQLVMFRVWPEWDSPDSLPGLWKEGQTSPVWF